MKLPDRNLDMIINKQNPSILVTRITHIGDTLLCTPALAALRNRFPGAHITALSIPLTHEVLRGNPHIDEVLMYPKEPPAAQGFSQDNAAQGFSPVSKNAKSCRENLESFHRDLKDKDFDIIINFSAAVKDYIEAAKFGGKYRIAPVYRKMLVSKVVGRFYLHKQVICDDDPGEYGKNPDMKLFHEVEQNEKVVSYLDARPVDTGLILTVFPEDEDFADNLLKNELKLPGGKKILAVQLSDRWFWKGCLETGTALMIDKLRGSFPDMEILCLSYPGIEELTEKIKNRLISKMETGEECVDVKSVSTADPITMRPVEISLKSFTGKGVHFVSNLPLKKFAALLRRCRALVTMHSGATHISAAVKLPSVVVFEPDYFEYYSYRECPWKVDFRAVKKPCRRDSEGVANQLENEKSMNTHVENIIHAVEELI